MATFNPSSENAAPLARQILVQTQVELLLTLRRGESVLITLIVPVVLLVFFTSLNLVTVAGEHTVELMGCTIPIEMSVSLPTEW